MQNILRNRDIIDTNDILLVDVNTVTWLSLQNSSVTDLTGIAYFPALTELNFNNNSIASVDLSNNPALLIINLGNNGLTSLNVSNNPALTSLNVSNNNMTSPNAVTGIPAGLASQINNASGNFTNYQYFPQNVDQNAITITTQPTAGTTVTAGSITGNLTVAVNNPWGFTLTYQWYKPLIGLPESGDPVMGATSATFTIPTDLAVTAGTPHYFYCVVSAQGANSVTTNIAAVTVNAAGRQTFEVNNDTQLADALTAAQSGDTINVVQSAWLQASRELRAGVTMNINNALVVGVQDDTVTLAVNGAVNNSGTFQGNAGATIVVGSTGTITLNTSNFYNAAGTSFLPGPVPPGTYVYDSQTR
jgi:hypothetical protein